MRWFLVFALLLVGCSGPEQQVIEHPSIATTPSSSATVDTTASSQTPSTDPTDPTDPTDATTAPTSIPLDPLLGLAYERVVSAVEFPVFVDAPVGDRGSPSGDPRLFVVSKAGRVWIVESGQVLDEPFLDIASLVRNEGEQGLLGLAFDPNYETTGRFFVHYSDNGGDTVLASYRSSSASNVADPDSGEVLFGAGQPASNHNGGMLAFGRDGFLYLALGDGGGGGDQFGNGQRFDTVYGAILRFATDPFGPAPGNPFGEVWAYGLRNPWRFAFDGDLIYVADVGQGSFEEINVASASDAGLNYGWPLTEGLHCFSPATGCNVEGLTLPILEVAHGDGGTCSITGGYVYRGAAIPELNGHYFYSDYCGGWLRSLKWDGTAVTELSDWTDDVGSIGRVTSFGTDASGEIYLTAGDSVYKIVPVR